MGAALAPPGGWVFSGAACTPEALPMPKSLLLLALIGLAGCAATPQALGLTGGRPPQPPAAPSDATVGMPGLPQPASSGDSGMAPTTGTGIYSGTP